jgi:ferritin-like metal-binding protein YciE
MRLNTLHDLYVQELRDLYSAKTQLIKAVPRMAKAAAHPDLRTSLHFSSRPPYGTTPN